MLPDGRDAALAYGKSCGQYSLYDMALGVPPCVGYLEKVPSSREYTGTIGSVVLSILFLFFKFFC